MVISIPKCAFENSKVDFAKTYLAGQSSTTQLAGDETNSCVGVENGVNIDFSIVADMGACGMETVNNGTHTFYKNAVQCTHGNSNAIISRSRNVMLKYECVFQTNFQLTFGGFSTSLTSIDVDAGEASGTYDVALAVYTDDTFSAPVEGTYSYDVPEPMHIAATLDTSGTRLKTQLKRCWATPSSSPTDETEYSFIESFCGTNDELNVYETLTVHANGDTAQSSFSLDSFTFTEDSGSIFLHCEVHICDSDAETCTPTCGGGGRRRRSDEENSVVQTMEIHVNRN